MHIIICDGRILRVRRTRVSQNCTVCLLDCCIVVRVCVRVSNTCLTAGKRAGPDNNPTHGYSRGLLEYILHTRMVTHARAHDGTHPPTPTHTRT